MNHLLKPAALVITLAIGLTTSTLSHRTGVDRDSPATVTTISGLSYIDTQKGVGRQPIAGDTVSVSYVGRFENGVAFDARSDGEPPFVFKLGVGQVIRGFDEGVMTMKVGGKRRLIIPSSLAYGEAGLPGRIPPNANIVFDVELLDVVTTVANSRCPSEFLAN